MGAYVLASSLPACPGRRADEPMAHYQSRIVAFILRERLIATLDDDQLQQADAGIQRAIVNLPAVLSETDLIVLRQLNDYRHWVEITRRARAVAPPALPAGTPHAQAPQGNGGHGTRLQRPPDVDPHGPQGIAVDPGSVHDVHPAWAQPTIAAQLRDVAPEDRGVALAASLYTGRSTADDAGGRSGSRGARPLSVAGDPGW